MSMKLVGEWQKSIRVMGVMAHQVDHVIDMTTAQEAALFRAQINEAFVKGGPQGAKWRKLSSITLQLRRGVSGRKGTKPLISSGSLRGSISVRKVAQSKYFIGVSRNAKQKGTGKPMVNIARVHEFGAVIPVTTKMRGYFRYLAAKGIIKAPLSANKRFIIIPQRSYLRGTMDRFKRGHQARAMLRFNENLLKVSGAQ